MHTQNFKVKQPFRALNCGSKTFSGQKLWKKLSANNFLLIRIKKVYGPKIIWMQLFMTKMIFRQMFFLPESLQVKFLLDQKFLKNYFVQKFFGPRHILIRIFFAYTEIKKD